MKIERLGNIAEIIGGNAAPKGEDVFGSSGLPFVKMKDLGRYHLTNNLIQIENRVSDKIAKANRLKIIKKGAILLPRSGSVALNHRAILGTDAYMVSHICALQVKNPMDVFNKYLYYYLTTINFASITKKTTGLDAITFQDLSEVTIPLPDLLTQRHIANILSKGENLLAQRKESIVLLDEFLKSTFLEMFGDVFTNKKGWTKAELKNLGTITTGNTPSRKESENFSPAHIEWIKTNNIKENKVIITIASEYLSEKGLLKARSVNKGALLVACIAGSIESVGRAAITDRTVSFNQQINAIQPNKDIEPLYLYWLFKISKKYIQNHASKGMKKILTKGEFEMIKMIKPPLKLQTQFAQIVEKTEALKTQYKSSLQELENLYGSLIQRAFKGELKLDDREADILMASNPGAPNQTQTKLSIPPNKKGFAKLVLAGKIISECKDSLEFTNIKFQKLQHLAEHLTEADLNLNYYNQAAGPYDNRFMHTLYEKMKQQKWFSSRGYKYYPMEKAQEIDGHFSRYFGADNLQFSKLIKLLGKASEDQCEIVSTLYAVWNDRIIKKEPTTHEAIIADFLKWSERKQKYTTQQLNNAIKWMKEKELEPKGFGVLIKHRKKK